MPTSLTPDAKGVLFRSEDTRGRWDVGVVWRDRSDPPELLLRSVFNEHSAVVSPDGRWMAYVTDDSGREEVYVQPFPGPGARAPISVNGGAEPMWRSDGRELFYRGAESMMAVSLDLGESPHVGRPEALFADVFVRTQPARPWTNYDVAKDGQSFLMMAPADSTYSGGEITIVFNWGAEVARLIGR
jgi:hypothetical protein